ncbi:relaxase [Buttiauxella warmboldiae]|uniref:Relaxase n=1 Tax=Buttiauxella warmboldiae TaxID=82993 RepID=A0A3N5ECF8_9ENTR|nr:MobH family relaxase [Buttiauxella warmboldiae]RPH30233.1 relaxase [Buttiauxella warmboldiae]
MLKWLRERLNLPSPAPDAALPDGWFVPQPAERLLATPLRQSYLHQLRQLTPLPDKLFNQWIITAIYRFALLVQHLPASQNHHHACPGGLLDHSLEVACHAARLRLGRLLPAEACAEEQARQGDAWTVAVICAALLHDAGKMVVDMEIQQQGQSHWYPWQNELTQPYRWRYRTANRDYHLHPAASGLMLTTLLPSALLDWLAGYPALFAALIYHLTGHSERAGILAELVQQADRASVAKNLGGDLKTALAQKADTLPRQLLTALRVLVQEEYRLNNQDGGSDGWLTREALWLVSKPTADRLRAWLLEHGVTGVPANNNRLFDELLAQQLITANGEKGIWRCRICSESGWSPGEPLTLLRIAPTVIWQNTGERPPPFAGSVTPVLENQETVNAPLFPELIIPDLPVIPAVTQSVSHSSIPFMAWLKTRVTVPGAVNNPRAYVHLVQDAVFLVTPGIFKCYMRETTGATGDEWKLAQQELQASGLLKRNNEETYIWICEVKSPGKTRNLKGFLLPDPQLLFGESVPVNNPWLRLVSEKSN